MALCKREDVLSILDTGIHGTEAMGQGVPRYRMPMEGLRSDIAHALVSDERILDGNARQNLATFCTTCLDAEIHPLMDASLDKNRIDKDEYPATAELESRCVPILANPWNVPSGQHDRLLERRIQ